MYRAEIDMLTSQRKALILDRLRRDGQVIAKALADELDLSEDTIRRDLREMAAEKLLKRVHGGALPLSPELPDFTARQTVSSDAKRRLGTYAAKMIQPGQTVRLIEQAGDWWWAEDARGEQGWLPARDLRIAEEPAAG